MKQTRLLSMLLALSLLLGLLPMAAMASPAELSGPCGETAQWEFQPDSGTLVIKGTGAVVFDDYYSYYNGESPWAEIASEIRFLSIEDGITSLDCLWPLPRIQEIYIPATLESFPHTFVNESPVLSCIAVAEENPSYTSIDGVLFTKDKKTLLRVPCAYMGIYTVPAEVAVLEYNAFSGCAALMEVLLPEGITEIDVGTFAGCVSLSSVRLPRSLKKIHAQAFQSCCSLEAIELPNGLTTLGDNAFSYSGLRNVRIPDSVVKYEGAFSFCYQLESLTVGKGVQSYLEDDFHCTPALKTVKVDPANPAYYCDEKGVLYSKNLLELLAAPDAISGTYTVCSDTNTVYADAFTDCKNLSEVVLPESVTCIGEQAFSGCSSLEKINIDRVTWIGMAAFSGCSNLREIQLPATQPDEFGYYAFSGTGLRKVVIPEGYTTLPDSLFIACEDLTEVQLPDSLELLDDFVFAYTPISSIRLPKSLSTLSRHAFEGCMDLTEVSVPEDHQNFTLDSTGAVLSKDLSALYFVPGSVGEVYSIPETVTEVSSYAFASGAGHTVVIPKGMGDLDAVQIFNHANIRKFAVAEGNPSFSADEQGVLYSKDQSRLLLLPKGYQGPYYAPAQLTSVDDSYNWEYETPLEIHLGESIADPMCFADAIPGTAKLIIPHDHEECKMDERGVLYSKDGTGLLFAPKDLEGAYTLPSTVTSIRIGAFRNCNKLTAVDMKNCSVTEIPETAFAYCSSLEHIDFPLTLEEVGFSAFEECTALEKLTFPHGLTTLTTCSFYGCTGLRELFIPETLLEMTNAFDECFNLRTVRFMGDIPNGCGFGIYDEGFSGNIIPSELTIEYEKSAKGFASPYWAGIPTRVFSKTAAECDGTTCSCTGFADVPATGHWAHNAIEELLRIGLFNGVGKDRFNPDGVMTRAMLVTILYRREGEPKTGSNSFTDVPNDVWYTESVTWAAENGIVNGVGNGKFAPNAPVTREQVATILGRYSDVNKEESSRGFAWLGYFSDEAAVSSYARPHLEYLVGQGVINGKNGKLAPQGIATRAEVATMLWRWMSE